MTTTPRDAIGLSERLRTPIWNEDTMKQWDSWRRMIAEMRGASLPRDCFETFLDNIDEERAEAATALDALREERDALSVRVQEYQSLAKELSDALLAVRPLGGSELFVKRFGQYYADPVYCKAAIEADRTKYHETMCEAVRERKRATRAEQERDEAYERAAKHFEESEHLVWSNDEAADAIRRLAAGPEKEEK